MTEEYLIGIDYGTDSARAVLTDSRGKILAGATEAYPRWALRKWCDADAHVFRQHPQDYLDVLESTVKQVVGQCPDPSRIRGIAVDGTSSTACFVDSDLVPLALHPRFSEDPDAMFVLWKDHSTVPEANEITGLCASYPRNFATLSGGNYSSECMWSKALGILRRREDIRREAFSMVELADYIPMVLTGCHTPGTERFGCCSAGAKHLWSREWGGFPPESFFDALDPALTRLCANMPQERFFSDESAGRLCPVWAAKLGLGESVVVAVGNIDSYAGATVAGARKGTLAMNIGTTGCFMTEIPTGTVDVPGVFGQVPGGIHRGMDLLEVGLPAFGDMFAWLRRTLGWMGGDPGEIMARLNREAAALEPDPSAPVATDNFNGRRSPDPDDALTAAIAGLRISTTPPQLYRALVEAAACATRVVIEHLESHGVPLDTLVAMGGVARKSAFVMQTLADMTGREIGVVDCADTCALGDAIFAAAASGVWPDLDTAARNMAPGFSAVYRPDAGMKEYYDGRYSKYLSLVRYSEKHR